MDFRMGALSRSKLEVQADSAKREIIEVKRRMRTLMLSSFSMGHPDRTMRVIQNSNHIFEINGRFIGLRGVKSLHQALNMTQFVPQSYSAIKRPRLFI